MLIALARNMIQKGLMETNVYINTHSHSVKLRLWGTMTIQNFKKDYCPEINLGVKKGKTIETDDVLN